MGEKTQRMRIVEKVLSLAMVAGAVSLYFTGDMLQSIWLLAFTCVYILFE